MNIFLIGSGAREHAIARAIKRSRHQSSLFCFGSHQNPAIKELCREYTTGSITNVPAILDFAKAQQIDWAVIGPEAPLAAGVVDALLTLGIPSIGPTQTLAQIETSKSFTRNLLTGRGIPGCPRYQFFPSLNGVQTWLEALAPNYVVKADGLMGGKGVKVSGDHLHSIAEALAWCEEIIKNDMGFVIEEKLIGQEFSLMSFSDGEHLVHMPAAQDHKRAFVGDAGPNTGGMGSYSDTNHSLPFLTQSDIEQAQAINEATVRALKNLTGELYKGILYGGFMATNDSVKLIEYNARFADPETMNVLPLLESDFVDLCQAIIIGTLDKETVRFAHRATVCKYAVPEGYPDHPVKNQKIDISHVQNTDQLYYAAVDQREDGLYETGSRALAVVGIAGTIAEAEKIAEAEIKRIQGPLYHRNDIGTEALIKKRIDMMNELRK